MSHCLLDDSIWWKSFSSRTWLKCKSRVNNLKEGKTGSVFYGQPIGHFSQPADLKISSLVNNFNCSNCMSSCVFCLLFYWLAANWNCQELSQLSYHQTRLVTGYCLRQRSVKRLNQLLQKVANYKTGQLIRGSLHWRCLQKFSHICQWIEVNNLQTLGKGVQNMEKIAMYLMDGPFFLLQSSSKMTVTCQK